MPKKKRSGRWTVDEARAVLAEQEASGLSVGAFAKREGIREWRLYRWRRQLGDQRAGRLAAPTPALIELRSTPRPAEVVEIMLASGVTLRVAETIEAPALARFVAVLR